MEEKNKLFEILDDVRSISDEISDEWITKCFESNFSDFDSFAHAVRFSILQALDHELRLTKLCSRLLLYAEKANKSTEIWSEIAERCFDAKKLCLFAWYLIERGQQADAALDDRKIGLLGAQMYVTLCCLNGAQAFNIFNDHLFQRTLEELRLIHGLLFTERLPESSEQKGTSRQAKTKNKKPPDGSDSTTEETDCEQITLEDRTELKRMLFDTLDPTFILLNNVSLSSSQQSSKFLATLLLQLMRFDFSEQTSLLECNRLLDFQRLHSFSGRSFALIHRFLNGRHASPGIVYGRIVMPRLLFWTFENVVLPTNAHPPRIMTTYKDAMLSFMHLRIQKNLEEEMVITETLLQNVCFRCPDRNDYRAKVADCVIEALACFSSEYVKDFATFLWRLGANPKIAVRSFAVEVALPLVKQYGHILEKCDEQEGSTLCNTIKKEAGVEEHIRKNNVASNDEVPMEEDEIFEDENGRNGQRNRKKTDKREATSDGLVKEIGLHSAILALLLRSCNDTSPVVRARALSKIAVLLGDNSMRNKLLDMPKYLVYADGNEGGAVTDNPARGPLILNMIIARCVDERVSIRKAAIMALESLFPSLTELEQTEALQIFMQRCRDPAVLVRKQTAESLSHLVQLLGVQNSMLDDVWLTSILPMISDREQSVVQLISKLVLDTIITPIIQDPTAVACRILKAVEQEFYHRRLLLRSLLHQAKEGELPERAVKILLTKCDDSEKVNIVWMLLDFLSGVFKIDAAPAVRFWYTLNEIDESNLTGYVANVIATCADRISEIDRKQLIGNISSKLIEFNVSESHITHVYYALARLYKGVGEDAPGAKHLLEFNRNVVNKSLTTLRSIIFHAIDATNEVRLSQENNEKAQLLVRTIISLGEAIQYSPTLLVENPKTFHIMKLIIASDVIQQSTRSGTLMNTVQVGPSTRPSTTTGAAEFNKHEPQQIGTSERTSSDEPEDYAEAACDQMLRTFAQPETEGSQCACAPGTESQEPRASQPTSHGLGPTFLSQHVVNKDVWSSAARAHAVLTIGKMCLQDEKLAKKCIPVFSRQLLVNSNHLVRSNIISVVCDLCKRYTLLVDRHSAIIASSLKDPSILVRKQAVMLLTHLIKEHFVRWEGPIMFKFVSTILDRNKEVRKYTEMCLVDVLLVQFPNMFVDHFLECVFHFNSVTHGFQLAASDAVKEDVAAKQELKCLLSGFRRQNARMALYKFMIKTCNDEKKFTIMVRIGQEVYSPVAEGVLNIRDRRVRALLEDCCEIMCSSEIKLTMALGKRPVNGEDDDDNEPPLQIQEAAKKVVTQAFCKGIVDIILPHILHLKYYLQEKHLPKLEFGIIRVLRQLCKNHHDQLDEFLANDKQLLAEIKFDIEKLEEKERRMKIANNSSVMRKSSLKERRKASFAANNLGPSAWLGPGMPKQRNMTEGAQSNGQLRSGHDGGGENVEHNLPVPHLDRIASENGSSAKRNEPQLIKNVAKQMEAGDGGYNNEEDNHAGQSLSSTEKGTAPKTAAVVPKRGSRKLRFEKLDEESELAARAVSTPQHNLSELTFGLGDEISAIESTPTTRKRSRRKIQKPNVTPIEEVVNENE